MFCFVANAYSAKICSAEPGSVKQNVLESETEGSGIFRSSDDLAKS
jgi:hypothetical protein